MTTRPATTAEIPEKKTAFEQAVDACYLENITEAIILAKRAIRENEQAFEACILLGKLEQKKKNYQAAREYFGQAAGLNPESGIPDHYLGSLFAEEGMLNTAIYHLLEALNKQSDLLASRQQLAAILEKIKFYNPQLFSVSLEKELLHNFRDKRIKHQRMLGASLMIYSNKADFQKLQELVLAGKQEALSPQFQDLLSDPLLISILQKCLVCNLGFEQFLRALRKLLLNHIYSLSQAAENYKTLIAALASQSFINEFIWPADAAEKEQLKELNLRIQSRQPADSQPPDSLLLVLTVGMYQPCFDDPAIAVADLKQRAADKPVWKEALRLCYFNGQEEIRLMEKLPVLVPVRQAVSLEVQQQYESYPYPRWLSLDLIKGIPFAQWIQVNFFYIGEWQEIAKLPPQVLVAGCGTGQHALMVARQFTDASVLALDLSKRSLAYALRMCREYQMEHVEFSQGDLLEIDQMQRSFSIIECVGTLHHMESPIMGWRALRRVLRPGGLMKIGLYSKTARRKLSGLRKKAAAEQLGKDPDAIRSFRDRLLQDSDHPDWKSLTSIADSFAYNSFLDLLFHPREYCFTIPEISSCLQELNLQFQGFVLDPAVFNDFRERFPDTHVFDLNVWDQYEQQQPDTFISMYQFWCRAID